MLNHLAQVDSAGYVIPCCQFNRKNQDTWEPYNLRNLDSFDSILGSDLWRDLKQRLLNQDIVECNNCWRQENAKTHSMREWANDLTVDHPGKIESLEIGIDITCNMMCRICRPGQSSKWYSAEAQLKQLDSLQQTLGDGGLQYRRDTVDTGNSTKLLNALLNTDLSNLNNIRINGGEPFYSKKLKPLLEKIDNDAGLENVTLSFNSNGSIFPKDDILHLLEKAKFLRVDFSIDAIGELANVIRYGIDWNVIENNIDVWKNYFVKNIKFGMHSTISLLNLNKIDELYNFSKLKNMQWTYYVLTSPRYLSIDQLPIDIRKNYTINFDHEFITRDLNNSIVNVNMSENLQYDLFIQSCKILDDYQGNNFKNVNSEMYNLVEELLSKIDNGNNI
tara:strand:+ start:267 stop:1436 length:1170 start_codon:yes stop_codon:yes gene_type:complete